MKINLVCKQFIDYPKMNKHQLDTFATSFYKQTVLALFFPYSAHVYTKIFLFNSKNNFFIRIFLIKSALFFH